MAFEAVILNDHDERPVLELIELPDLVERIGIVDVGVARAFEPDIEAFVVKEVQRLRVVGRVEVVSAGALSFSMRVMR